MKANLCDDFLYGNRQSRCYTEKVLLHTAKVYGICRHIPDVWRVIICDLLSNRTMAQLAEQVGLSQRTLGRIMQGQTSKPCIESSLKLLLLYSKDRPQQLAKILREHIVNLPFARLFKTRNFPFTH